MTDTKNEVAKGEYVIGIAIILAALLVCATIYISAGNLTDALAKKTFAVNVQGGSAAAPSGAGANAGTGAQAGAGTGATAPSEPTSASLSIPLSGEPFKGGASAGVSIVEYSDFECPFCSRVMPTLNQIFSAYGDKVNLYYKHIPLEQLHPNAVKAAEASECAQDQGKFWEMHDAMFADQSKLSTTALKATAAKISGMDTARFNSCLDSGEKTAVVASDAQEAASYGVSGTPSFYLLDTDTSADTSALMKLRDAGIVEAVYKDPTSGKLSVFIVGAQPFSNFKQALDALLQ